MHALYGAQLSRYYAHHGVTAHVMVLPGEEANKRQEAVTEVWRCRGMGGMQIGTERCTHTYTHTISFLFVLRIYAWQPNRSWSS